MLNAMRHYAPRLLLTLLGIALPMLVLGAVYKSVGPDGTVTYTDRPPPGATEIQLPKFPAPTPLPAPATSTTTAPTTSTPPGGAPNTAPAFPGYSKLTIVTPAHDATVRENTGSVEVALVSEPAWDPQWGHSIKVVLDGKPLPDVYSTPQFQLNNADRGTHTLQVIVLDAKQSELISSQTVTFHMKRHSAQFAQENPLRAPNFNSPAYLPPNAP